MASQYDGEIRIGTKIDETGLNRGLSKSGKEIDKITDKFDRQTASIERQSLAIESARIRLEKLNNQPLDKLEKDIANANKELDKQVNISIKLSDQWDKLNESGASQARLNEVNAKLIEQDTIVEASQQKVAGLNSQLAELKLNPQPTEQAKILESQIGLAEDRLESTKNKAQSTADALNNALSQDTSAFSDGLKEIADYSNRATKSTKSLGRETRNAGNQAKRSASSFEKLANRLGRLVSAALVFNVIRKALTTMREQLGNILKANEEFARSWNNIQVNLLTAFAPIWQYIEPGIISFMQTLEKASQILAKFMAMVFGITYEQAKDAAESIYDEANAIDELGNAANRNTKKLAKFDKINQLTTDTAGKTLDFGNQDLTWIEKYQSLFDRLIDAMNSFWDVIRAGWANEGQNTLDAFFYMLNKIKDLISTIAKTWLDVWTDGHGQRLVETILRLLQTVFYVIGDIAYAFTQAWIQGDVGRFLVESIFEKWTAVLNLLIAIGEAFRIAWNDGTGVAIATNLYQIYTNINRIIAEFADRLHDAWESSNNGVRIWQSILGLFNDVLTTINRMTLATVEWAKNLNLEPLMGGISNLAESFRVLASMVIDAFGWGYINILLPFAKWLAELFVPAALNLLEAAFKAISTVLEVLKPWALWIWENWLQPLGKWAGENIIKLINKLTEAFTKFSDWAKANPDKIQRIADIVLGFLAAILTFYTAHKITTLIANIAGAFSSFGSLLATAGTKVNIAVFAITALVTAVVAVANVWGKLSTGEKILAGLGIAAIAAAAAIAIFHTSWTAGLAAAAIILGIGGIVATFAAVKNKLGVSSSGISSMGSSVTRGLTSVQAGEPSMPSNARSLSNTNWKNSPLPKLATGTVFPGGQPYAAIVNDQPRGQVNVESPLSTIEDAVENVLMRTGLLGGATSSSKQPIVLELEGREVGRGIFDYMVQEADRRGLVFATKTKYR